MNKSVYVVRAFCLLIVTVLYVCGCSAPESLSGETNGAASDDSNQYPVAKVTALASAGFADGAETSRVFIESKNETGYSVRWSADETFSVTEFVDGRIGVNRDVEIYDFATADGREAEFKFDIAEIAGERYDYYAVSPAGAASGPWSDTDGIGIGLEIPAKQVQTLETAVNPEYMLMLGSSTGCLIQGADLDFRFSHLAAYVRVTVKNLPVGDGEKISGVEFSAGDKPLAGAFAYRADKAGGDFVCKVADDASQSVSVDVSSFADAANDGNGEFDVWLAVLPVAEINEFSVSVTTDNNVYVKRVEVPAELSMKFAAGRVAAFSVDMTESGGDTGSDEPLPEGGIVYTITADGNVEVTAGVAPAASEVKYTQESGTPGVLAKKINCTLTITGFGIRTIKNCYVRMRSEEESGSVSVVVEGIDNEIITNLTVSGDGLKNYAIGPGNITSSNEFSISVSERIGGTVIVDSFILVCE